MSKRSRKNENSSNVRHDPLEKQLQRDKSLKNKKGSREKGQKREENREKKEDLLSDTLSKKILKEARKQLEQEEEAEDALAYKSLSKQLFEKDDEGEEIEEEEEEEEMFKEEEEYDNENYGLEEIEEGDEKTLAMFMSSQQTQRKSLADIILEKIREKEGQEQAPEPEVQQKLDPKVVEVYQSVGQLMKKYTTGKIPKAFKIIPSLKNWEEVLYLTNPHEWTPQSYFQATKLFSSNLNSNMAQRFYGIILLPKIQADLKENKKLHFHLYLALKKALFKPAAFYKGILLPFCESGECTLNDALVLGSVLAKVSIPMLHSAAALLKIAQMPYNGANSLFIRVLLDKKYSLPVKVIDSLVNHFCSFMNDQRFLPVLWHQALLIFVQRYKTDINANTLHKEKLKKLLQVHYHHQITPEIRRELFQSGEDKSSERMIE